MYDYWGYYNVCYLGGEIRDPGRVIPRAILLSIAGVAAALPDDEHLDPRRDAVAGGREVAASSPRISWRASGDRGPARVVTLMMLWTAFASVFSLLLGYSRVPYAAALEGDYFKVVRERASEAPLSACVAALARRRLPPCFCLFKLADVVTALVVIRISVQFLAQTIGIMVLRRRRPDMPRPFRMWLYPVPAVLAFLGFVYVIVMRPKSLESIRIAVLVVLVGTVLFFIRRRFSPEVEQSATSRG